MNASTTDLSQLSAGSLRNVEYGLRLRVEGCKRRGQDASKPQALLDQVRAEIAARCCTNGQSVV